LRPAHAILDRQVLHRLEEQRDAGHPVDSRLQPRDDGARGGVSLLHRFQVDLQAPAVQRLVGALDADERRQALHGRVLQDRAGKRLLAVGHRRKRDRLRGLRHPDEDAGVQHREEALRDDDASSCAFLSAAWSLASWSMRFACRQALMASPKADGRGRAGGIRGVDRRDQVGHRWALGRGARACKRPG